jgi:hypothetical protein
LNYPSIKNVVIKYEEVTDTNVAACGRDEPVRDITSVRLRRAELMAGEVQ